MPKEINYIMVFGDSLSDRGTMAKSAIGAFSGLWGHSPHGRFTNGYVWLDYFIRKLGVQNHASGYSSPTKKSYNFFSINNDEYIGTKAAPVLARTYCVGGMSSFDYSRLYRPRQCLYHLSAQVLESLQSLRKEALGDDERMALSSDEKKSTLVIEWSGANDLITLNPNPTIQAAKRAVEARILNIEALITQGYQNFVLFNLPDLSLTPKFQNGHGDLRRQAKEAVDEFNFYLKNKINEIKERQPNHIIIELFDVNRLFVDAFNRPEHYHLNSTKKYQSFLDSQAFKQGDMEDDVSGYMFWDEVHPTEAVNRILGEAFFVEVFQKHFQFESSDIPLKRQFQKAYGMLLDRDLDTCLPFRRTKSFEYLSPEVSLGEIIQHGLSKNSKRTHQVLHDLGWFDKNDLPNTLLPGICKLHNDISAKDIQEIELTI